MKQRVHFMGIGGSGMSSAAGLFKDQGWDVQGSDEKVYPPASDELAQMGIPVREGYRPENLTSDLDLVVVGNVISQNNPEAQALLQSNLKYTSMAQALGDTFFKHRETIVVAGTHGKTTTTSLMTQLLYASGRDPGWFVGGVPLNRGRGFGAGQGPCMVVEGDEYDTAFFEKTPKFLHYHGQHLILTSVEFDHADIYDSLETIKAQFKRLTQQIPGYIVACGDDPNVRDVLPKSNNVVLYGMSPDTDWQPGLISMTEQGWTFEVKHAGKIWLKAQTQMIGQHNVLNAVACSALAFHLGLSAAEVQAGLESFRGVRRRQECVGEAKGVKVYDDFAHHPTAVFETLKAFAPLAKARSGRLIAVFEPRSNTSRRRVFQKQWPKAFAPAHEVYVAPVYVKKDTLAAEQMLDPSEIARDIVSAGGQARSFASNSDLLERLAAAVQSSDVVVFMSNGLFEGLPRKLVEVLSRR